MDLSSLTPVRKMDIAVLRNALNAENIDASESQSKGEDVQPLPEIFRLLASLDDDFQKMLLDTWAKMDMPLNKAAVRNILSYLENNPAQNSSEKLAVIKAFAFLEQNNLPYSDKMVDALRKIFGDGSLNEALNDFFKTEGKLNLSQLENLFKNISAEELLNSLKNFNSNNASNNILSAAENEQLEDAFNKNNMLSSDNITNSAPADNSADISNTELLLLNNLENINENLKAELSNNFNLNSLFENFDQKSFDLLNEFINENNLNSAEEKVSVIKAFAFLNDNKMPLTESLIERLSNYFSQENTSLNISEDNISKLNIIKGLELENQDIINKNNFSLDISSSPEKIAESIKNFSSHTDQLLSIFNKLESNDQSAAEEILGQKLITLQPNDENNQLMIALEIPVQFREDNELSSMLLKMNKNGGENIKKSGNKSSYNITFILELPNLGAVKSSVNVSEKEINADFYTESDSAAELIENNLNKLKMGLEENNFHLNISKISSAEESFQSKREFFNELILKDIDELSSQPGNYTHIDIRI